MSLPCPRPLTGLPGLLLAALIMTALPTGHAAETLPTAVVFDFELIDDQRDLAPAGSAEHARVERLAEICRDRLQRLAIYRVLDPTPAADLIERFARTQSLMRCNGCEVDIARKLDADRIVFGWVQKVSNLILNVNLQVRDGRSGALLWQRSADIRGNTDLSWQRGLDYLLQRLDEADRR